MTPRYPSYAGRLISDGRAFGSGFLVSGKGIVATCWHVVEAARKAGATLTFETLDGCHSFVTEFRGQKNADHDVALLWPAEALKYTAPTAILVSSQRLNPDDPFSLSGSGSLEDAVSTEPKLSATGIYIGPANGYGVERLQLNCSDLSLGMSGAAVHFARLRGIAALNTGRYNISPGELFQRDTVWSTPIERVVELAADELSLSEDIWSITDLPAEGWLYPDERVELGRQLDGIHSPVEPAELVPLIWAADEDLGAATPDIMRDPLDILDHLNRLWWKEGSLPPVLVFADLISRALHARSPDNRQADELSQWVEEVAGNHNIHSDELTRVRTNLDRRAATPAEIYIALKIDEKANKKNRFALTTWLYRDGSNLPFKYVDEDEWTKEELREQGERLLDRLVPLTAGLDEVPCHEFFLPYSLLGTAVDEWEIGGVQEDERRPLGTYCPVVVRLPGRYVSGLARQRWRKKWELLKSDTEVSTVGWMHGTTHTAGAAEPLDELCWDGLTYYELLAKFAGHHKLVCLALAHPRASADNQAPDVVRAGLNDGMPTLIWPRNGADPTPLRLLLADLYERRQLRSLPKEALALRIKMEGAGQPEQGRGAAVEPLRFTLVWDDPNRHPEPASTFAAPAPLRRMP